MFLKEAAADEPAPENQEESGEAQADTEGAAFNNEQLENPAQEAGATEPQESEPFQEPTAPSEEALAEALGELPKESEINEQGKTEAPAQDRESPGEATQEPEATQENEAEQETEAATEPEGAQEPQGAQEPEVAHEQEGAQKLESDQEPEGVQEPEGAQEPESAQEPEGAQEPEVAQEPEGAQEPEVAHEQEGAQELESDEEPEGVQEPEGAQELQGAQEPDDTQEPGGAQEPETVPEVKSEKETETSGEQAESAPQEPKAEIADVYDKTEVLETEKLNGEEDPAAELKEAETVEVNDAEKRENEQAEDGEQTETEKKDESPSETDTKVDSEGVASSQQFALQAPTADNAEGVDPISPSKVKLTDAPDSSVTNKTPVQPLPEDMQASARADALSDAQLTTTTGGPSTNEPVEKKPAVNIQGTSRGRLSEAPKEKVAPKPKQRNHCLNLEWVFGVNKFCPALSMLYKMNADDPGRDAVLYTCSNVAVMYSFNENSQILLQGHSHAITCSAVSEDKRWLVTADSGRYASIIVWDTFTAIPVQTIFDPHPGADNMNTDTGVAAITITNDAKYIASISSSFPQEVSIWDWTSQTGAKPVASITLTLSETSNIQTFITFNPQDPSQLVTNGQDQVVFYLWDGAENICYSDPKVTDQDFNRVVGTFSQSVHAPGSKWTFTATSAGNVVVWAPDKILDRQASKAKAASYKLKAFKLVRLQERALTVMTTHDQYVVTGDIVGCIKFYDNQLRMINWYQDFDKIGPINSLSFAYCPGFPFNKTSLSMPTDATIEANKFPIKDFIVSTTTAKVGKVQNDGTQLVMIAEEHDDAVFAMAAHPSRPQLCIGSHSSYLKIWDYLQKKVVCEMRIRPKKKISCLAYDPSGKFIALAFEDGTVRVIDSLTLSDELKQPFAMSKGPITHIQFSHNSKFLVTADKDLCIVVYKAQFVEDAPPFAFFGKNRAHYKEITGIMFGVALESEQPRLMSIGKDRVLVEYDLENSSEDDIKVASTNRIEQSAIPLSVAWYPPVLKEDFLITANDQYKLKLYNSTTKMCRKTVLGPTYGSPVNKVAVLPYIEDPFNEPRYIAFSTNDRVGLHKLPVLGNPHDAMVTVAHPQGIADLCCSFDSTYVFTAGGPDCTVQMWQVTFFNIIFFFLGSSFSPDLLSDLLVKTSFAAVIRVPNSKL